MGGVLQGRHGVAKLIAFNKPNQVLCQFTDKDGRRNLAEYISIPNVYVAGRLDRDSEGLLLLTDDGQLQHRITHPRSKCWKSYWVQVEGAPDAASLDLLRSGVKLKDGISMPLRIKKTRKPDHLWPRDPPIRYRAQIPTCWLQISMHEGRNRQIRRMTAAAGLPTLRLIRHAIGNIYLDSLMPGEWRYVDPNLLL